MRGVFAVSMYRASTPSLVDRQIPFRFFMLEYYLPVSKMLVWKIDIQPQR